MIKMSFYNGTLDRKLAREIIEKTEKPIELTIGFSYRNPTTHNKPISKEKALSYIDDVSEYLDITEYENRFHFNTYSSNDMW